MVGLAGDVGGKERKRGRAGDWRARRGTVNRTKGKDLERTFDMSVCGCTERWQMAETVCGQDNTV